VTRVAGWLASALVVALVITPVTYNAVKFALVAPVALGALLAICARGGRLRLHPYVLLWFAFYVALGAFFVTRGFLSDAPGTLYLAAIYVAFPLLYGLLVEGAHDLGVLRRVSSAAVVGGMLTCAYMFYYALWALGVVPRALFFRLDRTQNIGIAGGMVQMRLYAISGLVFLVPYVVASLVVTPPGEAGPLRRRWLWLAFVLGAAGTLLSGRKALMLTVAATPLVVVALRRLLPPAERARSARSYRRFVVTGGALLAAAAVYLPATGRFDWGAIASMIGSGFDVEGDVGAGERYKQARELVAAWTGPPAPRLGVGPRRPRLSALRRPPVGVRAAVRTPAVQHRARRLGTLRRRSRLGILDRRQGDTLGCAARAGHGARPNRADRRTPRQRHQPLPRVGRQHVDGVLPDRAHQLVVVAADGGGR
jgi:hypothetical protein